MPAHGKHPHAAAWIKTFDQLCTCEGNAYQNMGKLTLPRWGEWKHRIRGQCVCVCVFMYVLAPSLTTPHGSSPLWCTKGGQCCTAGFQASMFSTAPSWPGPPITGPPIASRCPVERAVARRHMHRSWPTPPTHAPNHPPAVARTKHACDSPICAHGIRQCSCTGYLCRPCVAHAKDICLQ